MGSSGVSLGRVLRRPARCLPSLPLFLLRPLLGSAGRVSPRRARHFSLLRQRKVSKRKATRSLGPSASLRATCAAQLRRGLAKLAPFHCAQTTRALIRLRLRCSAQPGRGNRDREPNTKYQYRSSNTNKDTPWRVLVVFDIRVLVFGCLVFRVPLWMRRGAQGQTDQGSRCLSEAQRSEFSETPSGPSTAGCP